MVSYEKKTIFEISSSFQIGTVCFFSCANGATILFCVLSIHVQFISLNWNPEFQEVSSDEDFSPDKPLLWQTSSQLVCHNNGLSGNLDHFLKF